MIAVVLSIIFPGLGQMYLGRWVRGAAMILAGATPLYPLALVWSAIDAYRLSRAGVQPQFSKREAVAAVLLLLLAPLCFGALVLTAGWSLGWLQAEYLDRSATRADGAEITRALLEYRAQTGRYPETLAALTEGRPLRAGWLTDGWGRPYDYRLEQNGRTFRLTSAGRDGRFGTGDDLLWEK
jgi:hypothetical protein